MSDGLLTGLQALAGPNIFVGCAPVTDDQGLLGTEAEAIAKAIPKRRAEFAAGRRAARAAMEAAGWPRSALPQGPSRGPVWPQGIAGSISHDAGFAIAAVAERSNIARLGIDLAEASDFPDHLRPRVLTTPIERAQSGIEARVTFSAKECVFKAFYEDVGQYFGFGAVEVLPALDAGTFKVTVREPLGPYARNTVFTGRFGIVGYRLLAVFALSPSECAGSPK